MFKKLKFLFSPCITIHHLDFKDYENKESLFSIYFLSERMAKRYWKKHKDEMKKYEVTLEHEPLWFW